jgi:hypothetical protein
MTLAFQRTQKATSPFGQIKLDTPTFLTVLDETHPEGTMSLIHFICSLFMFIVLIGITDEDAWDPVLLISRSDPKLNQVIQKAILDSRTTECLKGICESWVSSKRLMACYVKVDTVEK